MVVHTDASAYEAGDVVTGTVTVTCAESIRAKVRPLAPAPAPSPRPPAPRRHLARSFVRSFADDASPAPLTTPLPRSPQRVEVTVRGRERVTLQKTHTIPESELAPFHHLQGKSHKEHHAHLKENPKPEVRDLVKERDWRLRNGHTHPGKSVTLVEDVAQVETIFSERLVLLQLADDGELPPGVVRGSAPDGALRFSARVPTDAPSSFYVAGGNWNVGTGYLAEIVYTVSATVVGPESYAAGRDASTTREHEWRERLSVGSRFDAAALARGEAATAAAKRHFLVAQRSASPYASPGSNPAAGPASSGSRSFITGGALRASATLDKPAYAPGGDVAVCKVEANCTAGQPCAFVGSSAACGMALTAGTQRWAQNFDLTPTKHEGYPPGYHGERWLPFRVPPGWPSSTSGKLVRCAYGFRVTFSLPATLNLTLDLPVVILPTASMYASARPAGAPYVGGEEGQPPAPELPPGIVFRPLWVADAACPTCRSCFAPFTVFNRRHHCRHCGSIFCKKCAGARVAPAARVRHAPARVPWMFLGGVPDGGDRSRPRRRGKRRRRWRRGRTSAGGTEVGRTRARARGRVRARDPANSRARTAAAPRPNRRRRTCARSWRGRVPATQPATVEVATDAMRTVALEPTSS